jgi:hypothetical protein
MRERFVRTERSWGLRVCKLSEDSDGPELGMLTVSGPRKMTLSAFARAGKAWERRRRAAEAMTELMDLSMSEQVQYVAKGSVYGRIPV